MDSEERKQFYFYDALQRREQKDAEDRARIQALNPNAFKYRERLAKGNSPEALRQSTADTQAYWQKMREVESEANRNILADMRQKRMDEEELRRMAMKKLRDEEEERQLTLAKSRAAMNSMSQ